MNGHKIKILLSSQLEPDSEGEQCDCACADAMVFNQETAVSGSTSISLPSLYHQALGSDHHLFF